MLFAALALGSCAVLLASCGGDEGEDVQGLLDEAFTSKIHSADMSLEAEIRLEGSPSLEQPVRIEASGPFSSNEGKLPSVDLELKIGTAGGGQTITTGVLLTGDRAFVKFQDVYYEQPAEEVARANRSLRKRKGDETTLAQLGLEPRNWLGQATDEGEADVAGVSTSHLSGSLDVDSMLEDFNSFVRRSGRAVGGATGQAPPKPLTDEQIATITESVKDPSFEVYVGEDDGIIRRVAGRLSFEIPKTSRAGLGGMDGGTIEFSLEFADVNGDQEIEAPANARPLSALTDSLGVDAIDALGGVTDEGGGSLEGTGPETTDPGVGTSPETEDFEAYADCLDEAPPEDTEALQRCSELLQR